MKLALSYAGFLLVSGGAFFAILLLVLRYLPDENLTVVGTGGFAPNRSDLLDVAIPVAGYGLVFLGIVGLVGGWLLAGRMLKPLDRISAAAQLAANGSLAHRVALEGPNDEFRQLADAFDEMLDRLQHSFDEQRRFAANASHELRTPQATMRTMLEVARVDPANQDISQLLARLETTNERAINIVESLLTLSRLDHGNIALAPCNLVDVVSDAVAPLLPVAERASVKLTEDLEAGMVRGEWTLLGQLITNLVQNAIHHNHAEGGQVWIRGRETAAGVELVVENTGDVLDPIVVPTLTEPFVRGQSRIRRRGEGSGLGLTIVRSIADAHGAALELQPRENGGLTVRVTFPRLQKFPHLRSATVP